MGLCHKLGTWLARIPIACQILTSYWALDDVAGITFKESNKSQFQFCLQVWCWLSIFFGLATFISIKNFCDPELRNDGNTTTIYYDFLDLGARFAFMLCWIYYFVVLIALIHHRDLDIPPYAILLGFVILVLLAYVKEVNIKFLLVVLAILHFYIGFLVGNGWGIVTAVLMIINSPFVLGCTDPAPIAVNPTFIFIALTLLSCFSITGFFSIMRDNSALLFKGYSLFPVADTSHHTKEE